MRRGRGNVVGGHVGGERKSRASERAYIRGLRKPRRRGASWSKYLPLWAAAALVGTSYGAGWLNIPSQVKPLALVGDQASSRFQFSLCHTGGGYNCVVDGDTIWFKGQNIRVADIDAPETHEPRCASEKTLGDRATVRLQQLVNGGQVSLQSIDRDTDRYGRKLRLVMVDGESVGDTLVSEGLARWYAGGKRPWC